MSTGRPRPDASWLSLYVAARLAAAGFAAALVIWGGTSATELVLLLYGPISTALLAASPAARRAPAVWAADNAVTLGLILASGDWRSPFYLMWLAALVLPAVMVPRHRAPWLALGATFTYFVVAIVGGPAWGGLLVSSAETLGIHLALPLLVTLSLAYSSDVLRRLGDERAERERLAIEAERRRIAWELHDSAKQRVHAAHLLISSLRGRVADALELLVDRATVELESAAADMDTSLAELRAPLEGRRLDEALRARVGELTRDGGPRIQVEGAAPALPALVAAHAYRIGCEAIINALRHAEASAIDVSIDSARHRLQLVVRDDGRGLSDERRDGATGLISMESRATTIGGELDISSVPDGGTVVALDVPLHDTGGPE